MQMEHKFKILRILKNVYVVSSPGKVFVLKHGTEYLSLTDTIRVPHSVTESDQDILDYVMLKLLDRTYLIEEEHQ